MTLSQILTPIFGLTAQQTICLSIIFVTLSILAIIAQRLKRTNRGIPGHPLAKLTKRYYEYIAATGQMAQHSLTSSQKHGTLQTIQPNSISTTDPHDIRHMLSSPRYSKSSYYRILRFTATDSLVTTRDKEKVSRMRRIFGSYFNATYVARMEPLILDCGIIRIMRIWDQAIKEDGGKINYCETFNLATFSIISRLVFGEEEIRVHKNSSGGQMDTVRWMSKATTYMCFRAVLQLLPPWIFHLVTMPWDHYCREVSDYVDQCIRKRQLSNKSQSDLLQALVDSLKPQDNGTPLLSRDEVLAESFLLLIGGIDPTAYTMVWTIHLLLLYPEHLQKVQTELRHKFPPEKDQLLTFSQLRNQVPYLEACIYESMRLVTVPCVQIPRTCPVGKVSLQGREFAEGTTVFANIWGSHHSPLNWDDPERFSPRRFLDDPRAKHSVFAFGHGLRLCMGKHLAMMNMVTILANLLRSYNIKSPVDYSHTGPEIKGAGDIPKLMPMSQFVSAKPKYPERDCQLIVSRYKDEKKIIIISD